MLTALVKQRSEQHQILQPRTTEAQKRNPSSLTELRSLRRVVPRGDGAEFPDPRSGFKTPPRWNRVTQVVQQRARPVLPPGANVPARTLSSFRVTARRKREALTRRATRKCRGARSRYRPLSLSPPPIRVRGPRYESSLRDGRYASYQDGWRHEPPYRVAK